jgi:hypothetical protein
MKLIKKNGYLQATDYKIKEYSDDYHTHLTSKYETDKQLEMNKTINKIRTRIVNNYCAMQSVLDYGCGTGSFIKYAVNNSLFYPYGYEIIPKTESWLLSNELYIQADDHIPDYIKGICFWDVLEHMPDPAEVLKEIDEGVYIFLSIPIFDDLDKVKQSKHYIPNEHLWYFTTQGLITYMNKLSIFLVEYNAKEEEAGRSQIKTFVFIKR